jgi:nicotinamide riboside transporter PnuC
VASAEPELLWGFVVVGIVISVSVFPHIGHVAMQTTPYFLTAILLVVKKSSYC